MNKKGVVVELQFNWMFVMIVAGLILILTVGIISGITKSSNEKLADVAISYFKEIFANIQQSEKREYRLSLEGLSLAVDSQKDFCGRFSVKGSSMEGESIATIPFFSPALINRELLSYSLSWNIPFRANYFLYATGPDVAYVFVSSGGDSTGNLYETSSKEISKHIVLDSIVFNNIFYKHIRFISDSAPAAIDQSVAKLGDAQVSFLRIYNSNNRIEFYRKEGNDFILDGESYFFDYPSLLAAVYSDNKDSYECNIMKAVKRLGYEAQVIKSRIDPILDGNYNKCASQNGLYNNAKEQLDGISSATSIATDITHDLVTDIRLRSETLESINSQLNTLGCPIIY